MEHEFKVGDRIEQIRWLKTGQNKFAIVTKVEGNGIYHKHDGEGDKDIGWIMSEDIKLAEPESKFKVGDRVRIINDTRGNNTNLKNGAILTVKEIVDESLIFEDNYWIGFEEDKDKIIESSLELIKPEYKVGDRVRITKDSSSYVGSVGVLKMIDDSPSRYPYWVQLENNTTWVEDIELVGQPEVVLL